MQKIVLTSYVNREDLQGIPGEEIEVTDENRKVCEWLVKQQGARELKPPKVVEATAETENDDEELTEDGPLTAESAVEELAEFGIHARYVKALKDAGLETVGAVAEKAATLQEISGISDTAANQLREVLAQLG